MRSTLNVSSEILSDVAQALKVAGIDVVGSDIGQDRTVKLVIEGDAVPDLPQVECRITRKAIEGTVTLVMDFIGVQ